MHSVTTERGRKKERKKGKKKKERKKDRKKEKRNILLRKIVQFDKEKLKQFDNFSLITLVNSPSL